MESFQVQFILDGQNKPQYAVLPIAAYRALVAEKSPPEPLELPEGPSLLYAEGTRIRLPHGGPGAYIDLVRLADYCNWTAMVAIAINARQHALSKFPYDQIGSLDPMLRLLFAGPRYRNTMQATTEVVDALVESGLFVRSLRREFGDPSLSEYSKFYRPVNALEYQCEKGVEFVEQHKHLLDKPIRRRFYDDKEIMAPWRSGILGDTE